MTGRCVALVVALLAITAKAQQITYQTQYLNSNDCSGSSVVYLAEETAGTVWLFLLSLQKKIHECRLLARRLLV